MSNLAATQRAQGDLDGACVLLRLVLDARLRVFGDMHPRTLTSMSNLAGTLWAKGDVDGARMLHEQALTARRRVLGDEHPDTLATARVLAEILTQLSDARAGTSNSSATSTAP
jgi:hypothetical protein